MFSSSLVDHHCVSPHISRCSQSSATSPISISLLLMLTVLLVRWFWVIISHWHIQIQLRRKSRQFHNPQFRAPYTRMSGTALRENGQCTRGQCPSPQKCYLYIYWPAAHLNSSPALKRQIRIHNKERSQSVGCHKTTPCCFSCSKCTEDRTILHETGPWWNCACFFLTRTLESKKLQADCAQPHNADVDCSEDMVKQVVLAGMSDL